VAELAATDRFIAAAQKLGLEPDVKTFPSDTRTARQAADALGCELGQIVKSLIFRAGDELVLVLTSGLNRVDERKAAPLFGVSKLGKADGNLGAALGRLLAVTEQYPELKADRTMS